MRHSTLNPNLNPNPDPNLDLNVDLDLNPNPGRQIRNVAISPEVPAAPPLLQFQGVVKRYGTLTALGGIDLVIEPGSLVAILGPNGAGKSTLLGCLLGLTQPSAGAIRFGGHAIADQDRRGFGYLAERVALYPQRTVWDNAWFFARLKQSSAAEIERQLERVGLADVRRRKVSQLSKGMLQRLGLAIALCGRPKLLVLDEPFNGLDPALLEGLQQLLKEEQAEGVTLLIATHTISAIEPLATHVAILLAGELAEYGTLPQLRARLNNWGSLESLYHQVARQHHGIGSHQPEVVGNAPLVRRWWRLPLQWWHARPAPPHPLSRAPHQAV